MDWQAFFAMGGYAVYVWPSYGLAAVLLAANLLAPHWRERQLLRRLQRRTNRDTNTGPRE